MLWNHQKSDVILKWRRRRREGPYVRVRCCWRGSGCVRCVQCGVVFSAASLVH